MRTSGENRVVQIRQFCTVCSRFQTLGQFNPMKHCECGELCLYTHTDQGCVDIGRLHHSMFVYQGFIMLLGGIHKKNSPSMFVIREELQVHKLTLREDQNVRKTSSTSEQISITVKSSPWAWIKVPFHGY